MEKFMPKPTPYVIVRMIQYQTVIMLALLGFNRIQGQDEVCARMGHQTEGVCNSVQQHVEKP